ncbi:MAG: hypothetical protein K5694_01755 [Bacilli bacterium]|nr:hypothetical protein [Bacilli bacterium]
METEALRLSYKKILSVVRLLRLEGYEATGEGLARIIRGIECQENLPFVSEPYFGYLSSISKKKLKNKITYLVNKGYLRCSYSRDEREFLVLSELGERNATFTKFKKANGRKDLPEVRRISKIDY